MNSVLAVGGEDSVETGEVDSGLWHQGGQSGNKINRLEYDMSSAITVRCLEFIANLAGGGQ